MGIIDKIKALLKIKAFVDWFKTESKKEVKTMNEVKSGWKTTEFWLTVVSNLITLVGAIKGVIPADTAAIALATLNGVYGVLRALVKQPEITTLVSK